MINGRPTRFDFCSPDLKAEHETRCICQPGREKPTHKKSYPELTDDDLISKAGQEIEILERLEKN